MTDSPPAAQATGRQTLEQRYGAPASGRGLLVAAGVLAAALLAWLVWVALSGGTRVDATVQSFQVRSPHSVALVVTIHRSDESPVRCTVSAQAEDHSVVGEDVVELPAGAARDVRVERTLRTDREAVAVRVSDCAVASR